MVANRKLPSFAQKRKSNRFRKPEKIAKVDKNSDHYPPVPHVPSWSLVYVLCPLTTSEVSEVQNANEPITHSALFNTQSHR